jgi:hypothetical protein
MLNLSEKKNINPTIPHKVTCTKKFIPYSSTGILNMIKDIITNKIMIYIIQQKYYLTWN